MPARKTYPHHQSPLYRLVSRKKLARTIFNRDLADIESLASANGNYRVFKIKQRDKDRQVEVPKEVLERLHRRLFALFERIEKANYLHSGVRGRSYITNAKVHVGAVPLVKLDIKKFYPSVDGAMVARFFKDSMGCSPDVAAILTKLATYDNHVPTGSCLSQLLAYFAAKPMFEELHALAVAAGLRFTCYVDDMTWSGKRATPEFLWQAKQVIHRHGFSYHKERAYGASDRKLVTGVMIDGDHVAVLPSREFDLWKDTHAMGNGDIEQRIHAANRLIGTAQAASQLESRFLKKLSYLRRVKATALAQLSEVSTSTA